MSVILDYNQLVDICNEQKKELTETRQALKQAINALILLTEAKHIKDNFGKYGNYEQLKDSAWGAAKAALASIDKEKIHE